MAQVPWTFGPVMVTAPFANTRPIKAPPVLVKLPVVPPARMFPWKVEVVSVLSEPTSQNTLQGWAPPAMTTWKLLPVRAAGILKIQTALALPPASRVRVTVVNVSAATLQYTPGGSVNDAPGAAVKVWLQTGFEASAFEYALSNALCATLAAESCW